MHLHLNPFFNAFSRMILFFKYVFISRCSSCKVISSLILLYQIKTLHLMHIQYKVAFQTSVVNTILLYNFCFVIKVDLKLNRTIGDICTAWTVINNVPLTVFEDFYLSCGDQRLFSFPLTSLAVFVLSTSVQWVSSAGERTLIPITSRSLKYS